MTSRWVTKPSSLGRNGFTIVELLIVIVVIAILASITVVAFNGVQSKARDNSRNNAVSSIQKALEAYRSEFGIYPPHTASGTNVPAGFTGIYGTSYTYSVVTNGSWLSALVNSDAIQSVPVDPTNDNTHYFVYWASGPNGYGKCTQPFYMLGVVGYERQSNIPSRSATLTCTWGGFTASWTTAVNRGIFSNITTPPDPS